MSAQPPPDADFAGLLEQAAGSLVPAAHAPTMGALAKVKYTHQDMIDYMIMNPGCGLKEIAARYGYSIGWISNIQASDAWKACMAARRAELVDPIMHATISERFEGITALSLQRLQEKLEQPQVSDQVVLRAVELGARAMGVGGNAPPQAPPAGDHLALLADRLIALQANIRNKGTIDGQVTEVEDARLRA